METGFFQNTVNAPPKLVSSGNGPSAGKNFRFTYLLNDESVKANLTYSHAEEAWYFAASS